MGGLVQLDAINPRWRILLLYFLVSDRFYKRFKDLVFYMTFRDINTNSPNKSGNPHLTTLLPELGFNLLFA